MDYSLQQLEYDIHTRLPLDHTKIEFGKIPVLTWYEYHTSDFAVLIYDIARYFLILTCFDILQVS